MIGCGRSLVLGIAFLLLLFMIASTVLSVLANQFAQLLPGMKSLPQLIIWRSSNEVTL